MEEHIDLTDFNKALEEFTQDINNKFPAFGSYTNLYSFWLYDNLKGALGEEFYKSRQELLSSYKAEEEKGNISLVEYDGSYAKATEILERNQKWDMLNNGALFGRAVRNGWSNSDIWAFFIWKYFVQDKKMVYNIFAALDNEDTVSINGADFCRLCKKYRTKYGIGGILFEGEVGQRFSKLAKINPYITEMPEGNFCYPESMQDAIIECVSIRYGIQKGEYPYKAVELAGERIRKDAEALRGQRKRKDVGASSSKRELLLSWRDNVKYFSFDTFAGANRRLFLETGVNLQTAENWDRLTGSLLTNSIYRTFREMDGRCGVIASRMDDDVLKGLYFCIEKLLAVKELNHIEKAKFMSKMFSMLPLFVEKKEKKTGLKTILYSLGNAIRDFGIDAWHNVCIDELDKDGLLDYKKEAGAIARGVMKSNEALVKLWAENQKESGDSPKNKNTVFFQRLSRAILYYIYS